MNNNDFKELVINYLNAINLNLRYANNQISKEDYEYCIKASDEAILSLLERAKS